MHECPDCGQACDCDQEDTWNDAAADDCEHWCEGQDVDGEDDFYEHDDGECDD